VAAQVSRQSQPQRQRARRSSPRALVGSASDDGEPQAGATELTRRRGVDLGEVAENLVELIRRDAHAGVFEDDAVPVGPTSDSAAVTRPPLGVNFTALVSRSVTGMTRGGSFASRGAQVLERVPWWWGA
jgi:hypothetical protein